jgi:hypothetical protein
VADQIIRLAMGKLSTTIGTVLYQVPAGATTIIKAITLCNASDQDVAVTLDAATTYLISAHVLKARDTITIPFIDQVLHSNEQLRGSGSINNYVHFYISGRELS